MVLTAADSSGVEKALDITSISGTFSSGFLVNQTDLDKAIEGLPGDFVIKKIYAYADINGDGTVSSDPHSEGYGYEIPVTVVLEGDFIKIILSGDDLNTADASTLAFYGVNSTDSSEVKINVSGITGTFADEFSVAKSALGSLSEYKAVKVYVDLDGDFKKETESSLVYR